MTSPNVNRAGTRRHAPRPRPFALSVALAWAALAATPVVTQAQVTPVLPTGPSVVQGTASVVRQGAQMTVTNSAQAILNWQSFSIGAGGSVRFEQPNASSRVLNRVLGNDTSAIFGQLSSNGQVWLLNPNGVLFGAGSRVDVGGLVASTLNLSDQDWLGQRDWLRAPLGGNGVEASVTNQGTLRASTGGRIVLAGAGAVRNEGVIEAIDGHVVLAAGRSVDLLDTQTPNVALRVQAPAGEVLNLGRIDAGRIDLQGAIVNQQGLLRATSLNGEGGQIELRASSALNLAAASQSLAEGSAQGGRIVADAGRAGTLMVDGEVRADARAASGTGGRIEALGQRVGLTDTAQLAASGAGGGGRIFIGGGLQGRDTSVPNAESVYVAPGAQVSADATQQGDGGRIYLWSNKATRAYGRFSARGGASGGDGGFIETSGGWLDARPTKIDTQAPKGRAGEWLIDPNDLTISDTGPNTGISTGPDFTTTTDSAVITTGTIASALLSGNNVTLTTASEGGTEAGDIFMNAATLNVALSVPVTLTLNAWRDITLNGATIRSTSPAPLSLVFNPNRSNTGSGAIEIFSSVLSTQGGSISLTGGQGRSGLLIGTRIASNSTVEAPGGTITLEGRGYTGGDGTGLVAGVSIGSGSVVSARDISMDGIVFSDSPTADRYGVRINSATVSATRNLTVSGTATSTTAWSNVGTPNGVYGTLIDSSQVSVQPGAGPAGAMQIFGTVFEGPQDGAGPWSTRAGLQIDSLTLPSQATTVTVTGGSTLSLTGFSSAGAPSSSLGIAGPATINAASGGALSIQGQRDADIRPTNIVLPTGAAADFGASTALNIATQMTGSPSSLIIGSTGTTTVSGGINLGGTGSVTLGSLGTLNLGQTDGSQGLQVATAGTVTARSSSSTLRSWGTTNLSSTGTGSPVILYAPFGGALSTTTTLTAPNGRWLVYANDPSDFSAPGLAYDFKQYNASDGATPAVAGNALMFSRVATLSLFSGTLSKVYDGLATYTLSGGPQVIGEVGGDILTGQFYFVDANAGTGKQLNPGNGTNDPGVRDAGGRFIYGYTGDSSLLGSITPKPVTLSGVTAANKVYDGITATTLGGGTLAGVLAGQDLSFGLSAGAFATADVGNGKTVSGIATLANGTTGLAANYALSGAVTATADVTPRPLTLTGVVAADKIYDGSDAATLSGGTLAGLVSGQSLGVSLGSGAFADANAGVGKVVTGTASLLNGIGGTATNYQLASTAVTTTGMITPRSLTLSGVIAANKVYDGTTAATLSGGSLTGLVSGEDLTIALGAGTFASAGVGTAKTVTGTGALGNGTTGLAANYLLGGGAITATADITPRTVTVAGVTADTKVYDGTTVATLAGGTLSGVVAGEDLTLNRSGGAFATADAGLGKTVTGTLALANGTVGTATNYQLASTAVTTTGTITQRPVTLTGVVAADKVYDGNTATALTGGALSGLVAGQDLVAALTVGSFADANAGAGKAVTGSVALLNGTTGTAANYQLTGTAINTTATITPKALSLAGVVAANKVYDGTTLATLSGGALTGLVSGEDLTIALGAGTFASAAAGTAKTVTGIGALGNGTAGLAANYLLGSGAITATADITPRTVTVTGVTADTKVYDGTIAATLAGGTLTGVLAGEDLTLTRSGTFDTANAGVGKTVAGTLALANGTAGTATNYQLASTAVSTTGTITQRPVTLAGVVAANKVYDGTSAATLSGGTLTGLVSGEDLTIALGAGAFASAAAGPAKTVTGTGALGNGTVGLAANYLLGSGAITATADITPRTVTVTGVTADTKVYDGTIAATLAGGTLTGVLAGEDLTLNHSGGAFATADAGPGKTVTGTLALANGTVGTATNYQLASTAITTTGTITQRPVTLTGVIAADKVYDGSAAASLGGGTLAGLVSGQDLVVSLGSGAFANANANAGVGKSVTGAAALVNGTTGTAANYQLTSGAITTTATITPRPLTLAGVVAANKIYDGTTAATLSGGTLTGIVPGEDLTIALGAGTFASAVAGTAKTVTGTGALGNGTTGLAANYQLGSGAITTTADITPRTVTVAGLTADTKVYDGTTTATLAGGTLSGVLAGEDLTLNRSGSFGTADAGVGKTVTATLALANGTAGTASNYQLASAAVTTTGTITQRPVTLSGVLAADKIYDGNTDTLLTGGALSGLVAGQDLVAALSIGSFADANAGIGKAVTGSVALLSGTTGTAANYQLTSTAINTTATITPKALSLAGVTAANKVYDGNTLATLSGGTLTGLVVGEDLAIALGAGSFATATAGEFKTVTGTGTLANGTTGRAANYTLTSGSIVAEADITQRPVTVSGVTAVTKVYDATSAASLTGGTIAGLVPGENLTLTPLGGSFDTANAGIGKAVVGAVALANGTTGTASNYRLASPIVNTTGTITPKPVTIAGVTATDKVYDGLTTATVAGGTVLGTVGDDTIGVALGAASFNTANAGNAKPVTGAATLVSGQFGLASNYQLTGGFSTTGNIVQRPVTVTGVIVTPKTYDGSTLATLTGGSVSGLVGTEDLRVVLGAGGFITADAGLAKPVVGTAALADGTAGLAANYQLLSGTLSAVGDITPKTVTLSGVTAANKVYDGLRTASVSGGVLSGLVGTETLGLTLGGASFDTANAGADKPVTATAALADSASGRATNYVLASTAVSTTADITRKAVTVSGVTAADKTYDGTTAATLSGGTITGLVGNESLALNLSSGSFDTANAGNGKTVTGSVAVADGTNGLAANYQLPVGAVTTTASITPKPVSLASVQVAPKVYDGTTEATLSAGSLIGLVAGEDLRAVVAGGFSSAAAGDGKAVTGTATLVNGTTGLAVNYQLTGAGSIAALGDITPRSVTVSGVTAADKVYDGLTRATLAGGTVSGLVGTDDLQLSLSVGAFDTPNVGVGKPVMGSVALTNGTRGVASNYQLATVVVTTSARITPRTVTLTGVTAANKVYDGSTAATLSGGTLSGLVAGEDLALALGAARFSDPNAGVGKPVTASATVTNGRFGLATNYVLASTTVSTTANIDRAPLTYVANSASGIFGVDRPPLGGTVVGFVPGETLGTSTTGTLAFTTPATPASAPGAYPINGGGLSAQNYQFVDAPQNATAYLQRAGTLDTPKDVDQRIANVGPKLFPNPTQPSTPTVGRALDSLPSLVPPALPNGQSAFAAIDRANLSQDEIASVLAARSRLKKLVFAPAIEKLVEDPTLADAPACVSIEQAENGNCLLTERIRDLARIRAGRTALAPMQPETAPATAAAPATPASTSPPPAAVTTAAAPAAPAAPAAAAPTEALAVGRALPLVGAIAPLRGILDPVMPAQRRVRLAVLPEIQRKVAVLIGNDKYADGRIPALKNAGSDAGAVAATLEKSLGYETVVLKDATRAEILRTLNRLALELEPQDSVVIYYAGHGELIEATGQGYWQPSDADATRPETWISNNDIGRLMRLFGSRQVAMVSDSCFSGSLLGEDRIRGVNTTSDPKQLLQRRAAVVMTSGGNEPVFDAGRDGHSPFAWNLMRTIEKVSNWRPGSNLFESVRFAVARELPQRPQYGSSRLGGHETGSDYVFEQRQLEGRN